MKMVFLSIISSIVMYFLGSVIEIMPTVTLPGFGVTLSMITMGGFILFQQNRK